MTLPPVKPTNRGLNILKNILYVLAGLILVPGLITGISLMANASLTAAYALQPLQLLGGAAIVNMIAPTLSSVLINLGIVTLVLALVVSALLYALGRLCGHIALLEARLARLEAKS